MSILKNNKILLSFIVCLSIITLTSITTYSWFTASISSKGKIEVGTFRVSVNSESNNTSENIAEFNVGNIQPGVPTVEKTIEFVNSGSIDMVLKGNLTFAASEDQQFNGVGPINAYKITASFYKNSETDSNNIIYSISNVEAELNMNSINIELNNKLDPALASPIVFKPNEKLILKFQVSLDSALAQNTHQGDSVVVAFQVSSRQNVDGAVYSEELN